MDNRIRVNLMGVSITSMQEGAFAMLLSTDESNKRIPVMIGAAEAQAIAMVMEEITPQRPMTHDLFATLAHAYNIELIEVFIYKYHDGIFYAEMTFSNGENTVTLDARTSDAVAMAIRSDAPIYTTREILDKTGVEFVEVESHPSEDDSDDDEEDDENEDIDVDENFSELIDELQRRYGQMSDDSDTDDEDTEDYTEDDELLSMSPEELREEFNQAVANDDFEEAARIKRLLDETADDLTDNLPE